MARIETLTAYKCQFSFLQRNNPLIEEQREAIKAGDSPQFSFSDFIEVYMEYTNKIAIGENTDRAIMIPDNQITSRDIYGAKAWLLIPKAGKQGRPITVVKSTTGKQYVFGSDSVALYDHYVFFYEKNDSIVAIFHRQNCSGCKSCFLETANKAIKDSGLKLEMELIVPPMEDDIKKARATKLTLQYVKQERSSDAAENIGGGRRKVIVKDLGLNLEESDNNRFREIIGKMIHGDIDNANAFGLIKGQINDPDYNDAEITMRFGKRHKKVRWSEFDSILGVYDVSEVLHNSYSLSKDFVGELTKLADEYYKKIMESEVTEG